MNCSDQNRLWKGKWKEACARKWFLTLSNCGFWLAPAPNYPFLQMSTPIGESVKWCRIWISFIECRNPFLIRASSKQNASQVWKRNYIVQICHDFSSSLNLKKVFSNFTAFKWSLKKNWRFSNFTAFKWSLKKELKMRPEFLLSPAQAQTNSIQVNSEFSSVHISPHSFYFISQ